MYTCPPLAWTISQISRIVDSNTPCVDGYVIISAPSLSLCVSAFSLRSAMSTLPPSSVFTTTTSMPAMTALAGFVPCADLGIRHTVLCPSPLALWYVRITNRPANSPCAPALGCSEIAANPVISASFPSSSSNSCV
jgi:hypothetical protein